MGLPLLSVDEMFAGLSSLTSSVVVVYAFSALTLLVGWQEGHPACKKTEWWGAGVVVCLEQGADLYMAQWIPLPQCHSLSLALVKSRLVLPFWYRLTWVVPERGPLNGCVCVCCCCLTDDYHLTACISLMKFFVVKYGRRYTCMDTAAVPNNNERHLSVLGNTSSLLSISCKSTSAVVAEILNSSLPATDSDSSNGTPEQNVSRRSSVDENGNATPNANCSSSIESATTELQPNNDGADKYYATRSSTAKSKRLSVKTLELAIDCCQKFISDLEHTDLDVHDQVTYLLTYCICRLLAWYLSGVRCRLVYCPAVATATPCLLRQ